MLHLSEALATLAHVNLRTEKVGRDNVRPAADLKFKVDIPNTQLDQLEVGLLQALYKSPNEGGHQGDLMVAPETMTTPRFPKSKPFQFTEDWPGYFLELTSGQFDAKNVELDKITLKGITVTPKNGGTVELSFSLGCHPEEGDVAVLYSLMGTEVEITLAPPSLEDLKALRESAKKTAAAGGDADPDGDEDEDADPPGDEAAGRAFPDAIDARGEAPPSVRKAQARANKPKGTGKAPKGKAPAKRSRPKPAAAHVH